MLKEQGIAEAKAYLEGMEERDAMEESMLNTLDYLESHDMHGHAMPDYGKIELKFGGSGYPLTLKIEFDSDREMASASVTMPTACVKEKRATVADLQHRINYVMALGQWQFDPRDGECLMKYAHFIGDTPMSSKQVERMVKTSLISAHMHEGTIIPLMMGQEPGSDDACDEYRDMSESESGALSFKEMIRMAIEAKRREAMGTIEVDAESIEEEPL